MTERVSRESVRPTTGKGLGAAVVIALATLASGSSLSTETEAIETPDACAVFANPFPYQHKLIRLKGKVVRDFETFWIENPSCPDAQPLWIEYGGATPADGPVWHGELDNPPNGVSPLHVDGIETWLVADANFRKFERITKNLKMYRRARATLVGRVFAAGVYTDENGVEQETGFGPYGMYSLFVVHKVESISR